MHKIIRGILYCLPHKIAHKIMYKIKYNKRLNLENPKTIDDKLHWMMLNEFGNKEANLTDKILVKEYVKNKGLEKIIIKTYDYFEDVRSIDYKELPQTFVLKPNNASGQVIVCIDKNTFDTKKANNKMKKWLKQNWAIMHLEYHYKNIKPKIICEEYIGSNDGELPVDYKFLCFNGEPKCIMLCSCREKEVKYDYYDLNWNYLEYSKEEYKSHKIHPKPKKLKEMIEISKILSEGFKMVRVDLYEVNEKVYFGELTFSPVAGSFYFNNEQSKEELGNYLKL